MGLQGAKSPFDFFTITCPPKGLHQLHIVLHTNALGTFLFIAEHVRQARVTGGKRKQLEDSDHGGKWYK